MKVVTPTRLLAEAADVLANVWNDIVVVGAAALQVALAEQGSASRRRAHRVDRLNGW